MSEPISAERLDELLRRARTAWKEGREDLMRRRAQAARVHDHELAWREGKGHE